MDQTVNLFLLAGATLNLVVALLHFACIFWGANGYRILGAGEPIVSWAKAGHWYPPFIAFIIGAVFTVWALYALSAGGFIQPLPFLQFALSAITTIYLARAIAFPFLKPLFPGNSKTFWFVTSGICLFIGLAHLVGLVQVWGRL